MLRYVLGVFFLFAAVEPSPMPPTFDQGLPTSSQDTIRVILDPLHKTLLSAQVSSIVTKIAKKMGQRFDAGEVLIELDDTVYVAHQHEAQALWEKAKTKFDAKQKLFKQNDASLFELKEAEADVSSAEANLSLANKNVEACTIKAPYKGKVVDVSVQEFELAKVGDPLIQIVEDTTLVAKLLIPSSLWNTIKVGNVINIRIAETNTVEKAVIKRIGAIIDPASGTIRVDAEIDNADERLEAGMTGMTTLGGASSKP